MSIDDLRKMVAEGRSQWLLTPQVAKLIGFTQGGLEVARSTKSTPTPAYHKIGNKVLYDPRDVLAFIEARKVAA
jgi:hypothetical protein